MVQVIPKTTRSPRETIQRIVPWISILLVIIIIGLYFWFNYQLTIAKETYDKASNELSAAQSEADKELETRIRLFKERTRDVFELLNKRLLTSNVFNFLEANVHPDVYFDNLVFNQGSRTLELSGVAIDYKNLGEQMSVLDNEDFINNITLNRVQLNPEGNVGFNFEIELAK